MYIDIRQIIVMFTDDDTNLFFFKFKKFIVRYIITACRNTAVFIFK